jgi:hypothetical protein
MKQIAPNKRPADLLSSLEGAIRGEYQACTNIMQSNLYTYKSYKFKDLYTPLRTLGRAMFYL